MIAGANIISGNASVASVNRAGGGRGGGGAGILGKEPHKKTFRL